MKLQHLHSIGLIGPPEPSPNYSESAEQTRPEPVLHEREDPPVRRLLFLDVDGVLHPLRVRLMNGTELDMSHCFQVSCMEQLQRVVRATKCSLVLSSSWRIYEHSRDILADALAEYELHFQEWTTTAGGESNDARVDQILAFVNRYPAATWAAVDDEDLAPADSAGAESMLRAVFRGRFVRTDCNLGLDQQRADQLISILLDEDESDEDEQCFS